MSATQENFTLRLTLSEANTVRTALTRYRQAMERARIGGDQGGAATAAGDEFVREYENADRLLRVKL